MKAKQKPGQLALGVLLAVMILLVLIAVTRSPDNHDTASDNHVAATPALTVGQTIEQVKAIYGTLIFDERHWDVSDLDGNKTRWGVMKVTLSDGTTRFIDFKHGKVTGWRS